MLFNSHETHWKAFPCLDRGLFWGQLSLLSSSLKITAVWGCSTELGSMQDVSSICSMTYATSADLLFSHKTAHKQTTDYFIAVNMKIKVVYPQVTDFPIFLQIFDTFVFCILSVLVDIRHGLLVLSIKSKHWLLLQKCTTQHFTAPSKILGRMFHI